LLARDRQRREEFEELKLAWGATREFAPLTRSLDAPPEPFPEHRLRELRGAVQKQFANKAREQPESRSIFELIWAGLNARRLVAIGAVAAVLIGGFVFLIGQRGGSETVAYLVAEQGRPEIVRDGKVLPFSASVALQKGDQVTLPDGG